MCTPVLISSSAGSRLAQRLGVRRVLCCLLAATLGLCGTAAAQSAGPVAEYHFNEGAGATVEDVSGHGLAGTISGAMWTSEGRYGGALEFDGVDDWVTVEANPLLDLTTGMTLEAWVYPTGGQGAWQAAIVRETSSGLAYALYASDEASQPAAYVRIDGVKHSAEDVSPLPTNQWTHIAATFDGECLRMFVNGVEVRCTGIVAGAMDNDANLLRFGGQSPWGDYFAGRIDDIRIYDRALTAAEILQDASTPVGGQIVEQPDAGSPVPELSPVPDLLPVGALPLDPVVDPSIEGSWSSPFDLGVAAANMILLHTGKVLMYSDGSFDGSSARLFDPLTGALSPVPAVDNVSGSGHAQLPDGRVLVAGGNDAGNGVLGASVTNIFIPFAEAWQPGMQMANRRWHPTATAIGDGRVLVTSGATTCFTCTAEVAELFDSGTGAWTQLNAARLNLPYRPFMFVLPDGRVLNGGSSVKPIATRALNVAGQTWTTVDDRVIDGGSAAMYRPGKVLKSGSSATSGDSGPATSAAFVLDMAATSPAWRQVAPMNFARAFHNMVILPDGNVLAVGGGLMRDGSDPSQAVLSPELWSPATETWRTLAPMKRARLHLSAALLLPDARVLVGGGREDAEIYSPPYLFKGRRPVAFYVPGALTYGSGFPIITSTNDISSVVLIRPGATTLQFDQDQRYVPLTFHVGEGGLIVSAPSSTNVAPPGYYMLFVVDRTGVPSEARWVQLISPFDTTPPTPPTGLVATADGVTISLQWAPSVDNTAVAHYNVYRSTFANVTPTPGNWRARTTGTSYQDVGIGPGTHFYVVDAQDPAGNASAPSNRASVTVVLDTTPPFVAVTSPLEGAALSGTVTLEANASDNGAMAGVQFLVDGSPAGTEDTLWPYSASWNSAMVENGMHVLAARARDTAGNVRISQDVIVVVDNAAPQPAGLVAAYHFNDGSGETTADASGNGHTGTVTNGATWTASGRFGGAFSFDGFNDRIDVPASAALDLIGGFTLEAWVYPTGSGWQTIMLKEAGIFLSYGLYASGGVAEPSIWINDGKGDDWTPGTTALAPFAWTHMAATFDGAMLTLYINGVPVSSTVATRPVVASAGALRIGGNTIWGEHFRGSIDEVRIYNRALSDAEIQVDMGTPIP